MPPAVPGAYHRSVSAAAPPGNKGIWVGIFCVLVEFLPLFLVYFIARITTLG